MYTPMFVGPFQSLGVLSKASKTDPAALLVVLAFCYVAALLLLSPAEILNFARYCLATSLGVDILAWLKADYFAAGNDQNPLLMTWSLGVEEQFYLLFRSACC